VFFINNQVAALHQSNLSTADMVAAGLYVQTLAAAQRNLDVDRVRIVAADAALLR
jgi:hypothetical protein